MNRCAALLTLYVLIQHGSLISKATCDGMDQPTVDRLIQERQATTPGMTYQFVTKKAFDLTPNPVPAPPPPDPVRDQAVLDAKNPLLTSQQRLDAIIKAIDLK